MRKVVGQLKSDAEEARKPETWAKAVQGVQNCPQELQEPLKPPEPPRLLTNVLCDKENVQPSEDDVKNEADESATTNPTNGGNNLRTTSDPENERENSNSPAWILPPEETKPRRRKKGKKKPNKIE